MIELKPALSRFIGPDKLTVGLNFVYMDMPDIVGGELDQRKRGRAITAFYFDYAIYRPLLLPHDRRVAAASTARRRAAGTSSAAPRSTTRSTARASCRSATTTAERASSASAAGTSRCKGPSTRPASPTTIGFDLTPPRERAVPHHARAALPDHRRRGDARDADGRRARVLEPRLPDEVGRRDAGAEGLRELPRRRRAVDPLHLPRPARDELPHSAAATRSSTSTTSARGSTWRGSTSGWGGEAMSMDSVTTRAHAAPSSALRSRCAACVRTEERPLRSDRVRTRGGGALFDRAPSRRARPVEPRRAPRPSRR